MNALRDEKLRYLVHFAEGGSGMRRLHNPLAEGTLYVEADLEYVVLRVEHPKTPETFGHAWVELA